MAKLNHARTLEDALVWLTPRERLAVLGDRALIAMLARLSRAAEQPTRLRVQPGEPKSSFKAAATSALATLGESPRSASSPSAAASQIRSAFRSAAARSSSLREASVVNSLIRAICARRAAARAARTI
jgi:hypothetical protein